MSLYEKMYQIMCESEALEKSMTVGFGSNSYKAIGEASVLNGVKPLLKKYKLILFPVKASIQEHVDSFPNSKGETSSRLMSQVTAQYKIVDIESGESELLETVGNGSDPQDKGSGKAWTYAYKALLQKTFMLFSGEDTDNEHSDDIGSKPQSTPQQSKPVSNSNNAPKPQEPAKNDSGASDKATKGQIAEVFKLAKEKELDVFGFIDKMAADMKISTKYPYADKEKTKINWSQQDILTLITDLELPF
jgi:hypothetical protein